MLIFLMFIGVVFQMFSVGMPVFCLVSTIQAYFHSDWFSSAFLLQPDELFCTTSRFSYMDTGKLPFGVSSSFHPCGKFGNQILLVCEPPSAS